MANNDVPNNDEVNNDGANNEPNNAEQQGITNVLQLPDEMLDNIMRYLNTEDLVAVASTCQQMCLIAAARYNRITLLLHRPRTLTFKMVNYVPNNRRYVVEIGYVCLAFNPHEIVINWLGVANAYIYGSMFLETRRYCFQLHRLVMEDSEKGLVINPYYTDVEGLSPDRELYPPPPLTIVFQRCKLEPFAMDRPLGAYFTGIESFMAYNTYINRALYNYIHNDWVFRMELGYDHMDLMDIRNRRENGAYYFGRLLVYCRCCACDQCLHPYH